jgi:hypothetical protein
MYTHINLPFESTTYKKEPHPLGRLKYLSIHTDRQREATILSYDKIFIERIGTRHHEA